MRRYWPDRAQRALGSTGLMLLALFAACSDDEVIGNVGAPDGGVVPDGAPPAPVPDAGASSDASDGDDADGGPALQCGEDGFCMTTPPSSTSPAGQAVTLNDVWIDPDGKAWAVGHRADGFSLVLVFEASTWKVVYTGRLGSLTSISGVGRDEIWAAAGDRSLHGVTTNGTWEWTVTTFPPSAYVSSIWASTSGDAWACGYLGILHFEDGAWSVSLSRGTAWDRNWTCSDVWGTDTGEVWAAMAYSFYDYEWEAYRSTYYLGRRFPGAEVDAGAADAGDDDGGDAGAIPDDGLGELDPASEDGWRIVPGTSSEENAYGTGFYVGNGVHWVLGRTMSTGHIGAMRSKLEDGKIVFDAFTEAVNAAGSPLVGQYIQKFWATANEIWGVGSFGVYHYDGQSWALARTAIDGMPLLALGQPNGIAGDANQIVVVGTNIALRREVKP